MYWMRFRKRASALKLNSLLISSFNLDRSTKLQSGNNFFVLLYLAFRWIWNYTATAGEFISTTKINCYWYWYDVRVISPKTWRSKTYWAEQRPHVDNNKNSKIDTKYEILALELHLNEQPEYIPILIETVDQMAGMSSEYSGLNVR